MMGPGGREVGPIIVSRSNNWDGGKNGNPRLAGNSHHGNFLSSAAPSGLKSRGMHHLSYLELTGGIDKDLLCVTHGEKFHAIPQINV